MDDPIALAMKQKYRRPEEALRILGLDAALLEAKEGVDMARTAKLSPAAMVARSALFTYLTPRLAADSRQGFDFNALVKGLDSRNYAGARDALVSRVTKATEGKLAKDADITDLITLLQALQPDAETADATAQVPGAPPPMPAPGGAPPPMAAPPPGGGGDATEPHDTVAKIKAYLEQEGVPADVINNLDAFLDANGGGKGAQGGGEGGNGGGDNAVPPQLQQGQDEEDHLPSGGGESLEPRGANENPLTTDDNDDDDDTDAEDEIVPSEQQDLMLRGKNGNGNGGGNDRATGRDAAITKSALDKAIKVAQDQAIKTQRAIREAERFVRPWVGDIAMDANTAADVYRQTLKLLGVKGADKLHPDALRPILEAQPKPSHRAAHDRQMKLATDAAGGDVGDFASRWGEATKNIRLQ